MKITDINTAPPASTKLQAKLWNAFCRGNKRQFSQGVSALGAVSAANLLLAKLMAQNDPMSLFQRNGHLFSPGMLRCVERSEDFFPTLTRGIIYWSAVPTDTQLNLLEALSRRITPDDLGLVHPRSVSPKVARILAVPLRGDTSMREEWVEVAVDACDYKLLDAFKSTLTGDEWVRLWERVVWTRRLAQVEFLLRHGPPLEKTEDHIRILGQVMTNRLDQQRILKLLLESWPEAAKTMKLSIRKQTILEYWEGGSFRHLLSVASAVSREDWVNIFCWENANIFADQIDAFMASDVFVGWEIRNKDGLTFLIEADARLSHAALPIRVEIISKLLGVGADPEPLLQNPISSALPQEEVVILKEAAEERKRRKAALECPATLDRLETTLELV